MTTDDPVIQESGISASMVFGKKYIHTITVCFFYIYLSLILKQCMAIEFFLFKENNGMQNLHSQYYDYDC